MDTKSVFLINCFCRRYVREPTGGGAAVHDPVCWHRASHHDITRVSLPLEEAGSL
jgi:hypothetical protein